MPGKCLLSCIVVFLLMLSTLLYATEPNSVEAIKQRGVINVAVYSGNLPPFIMYHKNGQASGYDIDIAKHLANQLGVKLKLIKGNYTDELLNLVYETKADIALSDITRTLGRAERVAFSQAYLTTNLALAVNRVSFPHPYTATELQKLLDRPKRRVGLLKRSFLSPIIRQWFKWAKLVEFNSPKQMYQALVDKKVDALLIEQANFNYLMYHDTSIALDLKAVPLNYKVQTAIAMAYDKPALRQWINLFLEESDLHEFFKQLNKKYFKISEL